MSTTDPFAPEDMSDSSGTVTTAMATEELLGNILDDTLEDINDQYQEYNEMYGTTRGANNGLGVDDLHTGSEDSEDPALYEQLAGMVEELGIVEITETGEEGEIAEDAETFDLLSPLEPWEWLLDGSQDGPIEPMHLIPPADTEDLDEEEEAGHDTIDPELVLATDIRAERIQHMVIGGAARVGLSDETVLSKGWGHYDILAGKETIEVEQTLNEHVGRESITTLKRSETTIEGRMNIRSPYEDGIMLGGTMTDIWTGGTLSMSAMSDDMCIGGGARITAPVDLWMQALIGMEERPGTCAADGIMSELYGTLFEREYGSSTHTCGVVSFIGAAYQTQALGFWPMMKTAMGIKNTLPGGAGGGGEAAVTPPADPSTATAGATVAHGGMMVLGGGAAAARSGEGLADGSSLIDALRTAEAAGDFEDVNELRRSANTFAELENVRDGAYGGMRGFEETQNAVDANRAGGALDDGFSSPYESVASSVEDASHYSDINRDAARLQGVVDDLPADDIYAEIRPFTGMPGAEGREAMPTDYRIDHYQPTRIEAIADGRGVVLINEDIYKQILEGSAELIVYNSEGIALHPSSFTLVIEGHEIANSGDLYAVVMKGDQFQSIEDADEYSRLHHGTSTGTTSAGVTDDASGYATIGSGTENAPPVPDRGEGYEEGVHLQVSGETDGPPLPPRPLEEQPSPISVLEESGSFGPDNYFDTRAQMREDYTNYRRQLNYNGCIAFSDEAQAVDDFIMQQFKALGGTPEDLEKIQSGLLQTATEITEGKKLTDAEKISEVDAAYQWMVKQMMMHTDGGEWSEGPEAAADIQRRLDAIDDRAVQALETMSTQAEAFVSTAPEAGNSLDPTIDTVKLLDTITGMVDSTRYEFENAVAEGNGELAQLLSHKLTFYTRVQEDILAGRNPLKYSSAELAYLITIGNTEQVRLLLDDHKMLVDLLSDPDYHRIIDVVSETDSAAPPAVFTHVDVGEEGTEPGLVPPQVNTEGVTPTTDLPPSPVEEEIFDRGTLELGEGLEEGTTGRQDALSELDFSPNLTEDGAQWDETGQNPIDFDEVDWQSGPEGGEYFDEGANQIEEQALMDGIPGGASSNVDDPWEVSHVDDAAGEDDAMHGDFIEPDDYDGPPPPPEFSRTEELAPTFGYDRFDPDAPDWVEDSMGIEESMLRGEFPASFDTVGIGNDFALRAEHARAGGLTGEVSEDGVNFANFLDDIAELVERGDLPNDSLMKAAVDLTKRAEEAEAAGDFARATKLRQQVDIIETMMYEVRAALFDSFGYRTDPDWLAQCDIVMDLAAQGDEFGDQAAVEEMKLWELYNSYDPDPAPLPENYGQANPNMVEDAGHPTGTTTGSSAHGASEGDILEPEVFEEDLVHQPAPEPPPRTGDAAPENNPLHADDIEELIESMEEVFIRGGNFEDMKSATNTALPQDDAARIADEAGGQTFRLDMTDEEMDELVNTHLRDGNVPPSDVYGVTKEEARAHDASVRVRFGEDAFQNMDESHEIRDAMKAFYGEPTWVVNNSPGSQRLEQMRTGFPFGNGRMCNVRAQFPFTAQDVFVNHMMRGESIADKLNIVFDLQVASGRIQARSKQWKAMCALLGSLQIYAMGLSTSEAALDFNQFRTATEVAIDFNTFQQLVDLGSSAGLVL